MAGKIIDIAKMFLVVIEKKGPLKIDLQRLQMFLAASGD
jgi:hypothetical protein